MSGCSSSITVTTFCPHLLGDRDETRHLIVADRQLVIAPRWSLHSGVGTTAYSFVWAMAGENQSFDTGDATPIADLRRRVPCCWR
nr:5-deoxy-glucuronate isomerase [Microbacterium protaetiae]